MKYLNSIRSLGLIALVCLGGTAKALPTKRSKHGDETREAVMQAYAKGDLVPFTLELMRSAKSSAELVARDQQIKKLLMMQSICQDELLGKHNPFHCYRLIQIEKTIGFLRPKTALQTTQFLDELCTVQIHDIPVLDSDERAALSTSCQHVLFFSEQRSRYVQSETQPSIRFAQRFERSKSELDTARVESPDFRHRTYLKPVRAITNTLK